jgi:hypothetical protein
MDAEMKTVDRVRDKIGRLTKGYVFTYDDFITTVDDREAVIKALNRMAEAGDIEKLSKGRFYKAEVSPFGKLEPDQYNVAKDLLEKDGKIIGYLTGYSIYNQLNLSTQVSYVIQIGRNDIRPKLKRDRYEISFVKQKNNITKENIPLLQILDAMRFLKQIPDASNAFLCKRFKAILKNLTETDVKKMLKLSLKYPPATRALLGAILSEIKPKMDLDMIRKSLNPITTYKLGMKKEDLLNIYDWNIK